MSSSNNIEERIANIEKAIKHNEFEESIKEDLKFVINYIRESLKSLDAPKDDRLMAELYKLAAISGMQVSKMTRDQVTNMLAEVIQKRELRRKFADKTRKMRRR